MRGTPEELLQSELLLATCRRKSDAQLAGSVIKLQNEKFRDAFVDLAGRHGVLGLAASAVRKSGLIATSPADAVFESVCRSALRRAMVLQIERDHILRALAARGVAAVVLKGAGLVSTVYASPIERDYGDIDILVADNDVKPATSALAALGYVAQGSDAVSAGYMQHHFHLRVQRPGGAIVEIHWAVTRADETYSLDANAFLSEGRTHAALPYGRVPRPEHALMHIVVENVRDSFTRLTRLVDIDRIVASAPDMDWRYLETFARAAHLLPSLSLVLELSGKLLGTSVPGEFRKRISPSRAVRAHLALLNVPRSLLTQRALRRPSWGTLLQLWLVDDRSRLAALARVLRGDDDEPLEWLWLGEETPREIKPGFGKRAAKVGKLVGYQLGTYSNLLRP